MSSAHVYLRLPKVDSACLVALKQYATVYYASTLCPTVYLRLLVDSAHPVALKQNSILQYTVPVYYASTLCPTVYLRLLVDSAYPVALKQKVYYSILCQYTMLVYILWS